MSKHSSLEHKDFVLEALQELEENQCIVKVQYPPHLCSPLSVAVNSQEKRRLVLNLHYLNQILWTEKFKYEDVCVAMLMFQKGDYLFAFELKSGYHHIDIFEPHRQYLLRASRCDTVLLICSPTFCVINDLLCLYKTVETF